MFGMELRSQKRWNGLAFCLFWVFVSGLVAHGYAYFNASFSHDALFQLSADDHLWQLSLGRFLQPVVRAIRGQISSPWLLGALSLLYIALAAWLIVSLLELRSPLWRALTCAVLTVNTTVTLLNATYLPWVDMFMLSMLLAVAAVYLFERRGRAGLRLPRHAPATRGCAGVEAAGVSMGHGELAGRGDRSRADEGRQAARGDPEGGKGTGPAPHRLRPYRMEADRRQVGGPVCRRGGGHERRFARCGAVHRAGQR